MLLTVLDSLDWADPLKHQMALQQKFNGCLAFVESGEILKSHAQAAERLVAFHVVFRHSPSAEGMLFLERPCLPRGST